MLAWIFAEPFLFAVIAVAFIMNTASAVFDDEGFYGWSIALTVAAAVAVVSSTYGSLADKLSVLAVGAAIYFCVGVSWSVKKWIDFIIKKREWAKENYGADFNKRCSRPTASDNKVLLVSWMLFWPWSVTWWVLTWPRHAFIWAYNRLAVQFDALSERLWK